jgi:pimeloyl-ACP methyl ester carboxylesterase
MQMFPSGTDEETFRAFVRIHRMAATVQMQEGLDTVRFDLEPLLDKVITPTMVLHRRGDQACPFGIGENVARRIAGARFVPLEGDSHFPWVGDWQSMAGAILDFLLDGSDRGSARAPIKR